MGKQIAKTIGYISSSVFKEISDNLNLANYVKPSPKIHFTKSYREAMQKDWEAVGKGVQKSIERFEKEIYGVK